MFLGLNNKFINLDNVFEIYAVDEDTNFEHGEFNYHMDKPGLIFICDSNLTGIEFDSFELALTKLEEIEEKFGFIKDEEDCIRLINPANIFDLEISENKDKIKNKEINISFEFKNAHSSDFNTSILNALNIKKLLLGDSKLDDFNNLSYSDKIKQLRTETDITFLTQILPSLTGEMKKIAERQLARL